MATKTFDRFSDPARASLLLALLKVDGGRRAGVIDSLGVVAKDLRAKVMDDLRRLERPGQSLESVPAPAERAASAALERLAAQEIAELEVTLRDAV